MRKLSKNELFERAREYNKYIEEKTFGIIERQKSSDKEIIRFENEKGIKMEEFKEIGKQLGQKASKRQILQIVNELGKVNIEKTYDDLVVLLLSCKIDCMSLIELYAEGNEEKLKKVLLTLLMAANEQ